jgi:acyl dehydratase
MLASRTFSMADQIRFATVSGDRNPMHLDAIVARRTQAGVPAVHGIHLLLWSLDVLARAHAGQASIRRLTVHFNHFVAIGETVTATRAKRNDINSRFDLVLDLAVAGLTVARIMVDFGAPARTADAPFSDAITAPAEP